MAFEIDVNVSWHAIRLCRRRGPAVGRVHAAPVARADVLLRYPQLRRAIEKLAGRISASDMQAMNYAADALHEDPAAIARRFLSGVH